MADPRQELLPLLTRGGRKGTSTHGGGARWLATRSEALLSEDCSLHSEE